MASSNPPAKPGPLAKGDEVARFDRAGVELVLDLSNAALERTVVFLPTAGEARLVWRPISERVGAMGWRCVAPDYRGHGASGWASSYELEELCLDVLGVIERYAGAPLVLVGGSIGGVIAMLLAGEKKVDVSGLVLIDIVPAPRFEAGQRERAKIAVALERRDRAVDSLDPKVRDGKLATEVIAQRDRIVAAARAIRVPTLLLHGGGSHVIGRAELAAFERSFRQPEILEIEGAGHLVARDQPERVAQALARYLARHFPVEPRRKGEPGTPCA